MFIMESMSSKTLCVPSVFISYHGDALDEKTGRGTRTKNVVDGDQKVRVGVKSGTKFSAAGV